MAPAIGSRWRWKAPDESHGALFEVIEVGKYIVYVYVVAGARGEFANNIQSRDRFGCDPALWPELVEAA